MIGTLLAHSGARQISREKLNTIEPPRGTRTWKPIGHDELVSALEAELGWRGLSIRAEAFAVQRSGAVLFGVLDLAWRRTDEFAAAIGLRTANDKTLSLQIAVGLRVFVCDNLVFSGDLIALRRRHTARLELSKEIAGAMDRYQEGALDLERGIARLKDLAVSEARAKGLVFDVFRQGILPLHFFRPVSKVYFDGLADEPTSEARTLWFLYNVFTSQVRWMPPATAFRATIRLGRLFGLGRTVSHAI